MGEWINWSTRDSVGLGDWATGRRATVRKGKWETACRIGELGDDAISRLALSDWVMRVR